MIQILTIYCSLFFQEKYNKFIESLNFSSLTCPHPECGFRGQCTRHAYYKRNIITEYDKKYIRILRVKCLHCKKTHALLPNWIVPYSQHLVADHIEIIGAYHAGISPYTFKPSNPEINTWSVVYIVKQFEDHWKGRLLSLVTSIFDGMDEIISSCFISYKRQFMQIKRTRNALFIPPT